MVRFTVDGREVAAEDGKSLLEACLDNGIYIPNLCFLKEMQDPPASCRLCFVHIEGEARPVTSCKVSPREGMVVRTDTEEIRRLQRTALELLLSVHHIDCRNCPANKKCPLQNMAKFLRMGLKPKHIAPLTREKAEKQDLGHFTYDPLKCVLCGRCIFVCREVTGQSLLTFARRGFDTIVSSFGGHDSQNHTCDGCRACVDVCPVAALLLKDPQAGRLPPELNPDAADSRI